MTKTGHRPPEMSFAGIQLPIKNGYANPNIGKLSSSDPNGTDIHLRLTRRVGSRKAL
jgi:hypothetical protein